MFRGSERFTIHPLSRNSGVEDVMILMMRGFVVMNYVSIMYLGLGLLSMLSNLFKLAWYFFSIIIFIDGPSSGKAVYWLERYPGWYIIWVNWHPILRMVY